MKSKFIIATSDDSYKVSNNNRDIKAIQEFMQIKTNVYER